MPPVPETQQPQPDVQPEPEPEEIVYADPNVPLQEQTNETADDFVETISQNETIEDDNTSIVVETNETLIESNLSFENIDLKPASSFTIANWNLQIFGQSKASEPEVMDFYDAKMSDYDIIFIQEIRDASGTAFPTLCQRMEGYECAVSQRDGRSSSKEQIGVIYKENYELIELVDLADPDDVWERSPTMVKFNVEGYEFTAYNAHLKPDDVDAELNAMEEAIINEGNVIVLGDLNADCDYYNPLLDGAFDSWNWLIANSADTTVSQTDCAYDRIFVNDDMKLEIGESGVDKEGINKTFSDHYLVFTEVKI